MTVARPGGEGSLLSTDWTSAREEILSQSAWDDCAVGTLIYTPREEYSIKTTIELQHGESTAIQLDVTVTRGADLTYQMILVHDTSDFEFNPQDAT
ncbi:hypothetical protein PEBR_20521 [Penicillium brasilianum]|uniref:Uncharacterized protein n=1 Tax=Penicillium brasilianum TaxID=104259 RepID=A0A1S9RM65_PENBI|nr:hypothetical protein PEBR_20521 [Penicillium brasilianum]